MTIPDLRLAVQLAESAHEAVRTNADKAAAKWRADLAALGNAPPVEKEPTEPVAPIRVRPADDVLATARTLVDGSAVARDRARRYAADLASAEADAEAKDATKATTAARATLVTATLAARRQAPTDIAREQADMLSTPLVRFVFPVERGQKDPHVTAEYAHPKHGWIPFACASTGEQAEATPGVQQRLRELAAKVAPAWAHVPIVVDVQDYNGGSGPFPDVAGFSIWHVSTAEGTPLTVSAGRPG